MFWSKLITYDENGDMINTEKQHKDEITNFLR